MVYKKYIEDPDRPVCCGKPMAHGPKAQSGRQRYKCSYCNSSTTGSDESNGQRESFGYDTELAHERWQYLKKQIKDGARIVVTCAQNNSRVMLTQLQSLERYCKHNNAELVVIPMHHKNITLFHGKKYKKEWSEYVAEYLIDQPLKIGRVVIQADIKIQATMFNPLVGKEPIGGPNWTIFGHPQFAMETVAAIDQPKRMYTSGSITTKNYSRTNAGAKAKFHHVQGALIIETKGRKTFVRQLNADSSGCFYDLDKLYTPRTVVKNQKILGLVTGDSHVKHHLKSVRKATYDAPASIVKTLKPKNIVRHDILDTYFGSHWHEKNDVLQFRKHFLGDNDGRKELDAVVRFLNETTPKDTTNIIVASNHHDHLYQWLSRVDPRKDPVNALLIHELKALQYNVATIGKTYDPHDTDPFRLYVEPKLTCGSVFLRRTQHYFLAKIDVSQHGDVGTNGTRGNARGLSKATHKMVIGHGHGAKIVRGVYQVGKSSGRHEYERGLGNHTHTHCIIYPNGKRSLIDIFGTDWRA